jgi:hypothetical protein
LAIVVFGIRKNVLPSFALTNAGSQWPMLAGFMSSIRYMTGSRSNRSRPVRNMPYASCRCLAERFGSVARRHISNRSG